MLDRDTGVEIAILVNKMFSGYVCMEQLLDAHSFDAESYNRHASDYNEACAELTNMGIPVSYLPRSLRPVAKIQDPGK